MRFRQPKIYSGIGQKLWVVALIEKTRNHVPSVNGQLIEMGITPDIMVVKIRLHGILEPVLESSQLLQRFGTLKSKTF